MINDEYYTLSILLDGGFTPSYQGSTPLFGEIKGNMEEFVNVSASPVIQAEDFLVTRPKV